MTHLTIIIPTHNEAASLRELHHRLTTTLRQHLSMYTYNIIYINDGSTDTTGQQLQDICQWPPATVIHFPVNQGKSPALTAGFQAASGDIIVTLDGLQDRPENIPLLIQKMEDGWDLVVGWKRVRRDPRQKTIPSRVFNAAVRAVWKLPLHDINCGLKAIRRPAIDQLTLDRDEHRFLPLFIYQRGFHVTEVAITHDARKHGHSKYGWSRLLNGFTSFTNLLLFPRHLHYTTYHKTSRLLVFALLISLLTLSHL